MTMMMITSVAIDTRVVTQIDWIIDEAFAI